MRPLRRNTVELPGPALAPGPAAHNLEFNVRLPQSVYISIVRFAALISKGSSPNSTRLLPTCASNGAAGSPALLKDVEMMGACRNSMPWSRTFPQAMRRLSSLHWVMQAQAGSATTRTAPSPPPAVDGSPRYRGPNHLLVHKAAVNRSRK